MVEIKEEIWKNVIGYEGLYQVSNLGRVKSLDRIDSRGCKHKGRMLRLANSHGYKVVGLSNCGKLKVYFVHRLLAEAFISNPENKPQVNHIDGNKANSNINNLEWCTPKENNIHAIKTGLRTFKTGENNPLHTKFKGEGNPMYGKVGCMFGKHHSQEAKLKISKVHKGKTISEETKRKMSLSRKGVLAGEKHPFYGKIGPGAKKVKCITTGKIFNSVKEASVFYKCSNSHIIGCCKGNRNYCGTSKDGIKLQWCYWKGDD